MRAKYAPKFPTVEPDDYGNKQPHSHPQPGPRDRRGNCPACVDYNPERYGLAGKQPMPKESEDESAED